MIISLVLFSVVIVSDYNRVTAEMITDAQATNASLVRSGSENFRVSYLINGKRPVHAVGSFSWSGNDGLWTFRFSDPDHTMTGQQDFSGEVEDAPLNRVLRVGNKIHFYNPLNSSLHIYEIKPKVAVWASYFMIDLFPTTLWSRCCPPNHTRGRLWSEMLGPGSPASYPDSSHDLASIGPALYRHTRTDPNRGRSITDYSMEFAGHATDHVYTISPSNQPIKRVRYDWQKLGHAVVLKGCEVVEMDKKDPTQGRRTYTAQFDRIDVASPVPGSKFAFDEFTKLLPRNTLVNDHITLKSYPLHRSPTTAGITDDSLQDLARKLRAGGFLREAKP